MIEVSKLIINIILAIFLAGSIGYERQVRRGIYSVGIRTHILLCFVVMILTSVSIDGFPLDSARIIAGVISAVGFIAAGTIIGHREEVLGLTTGIGLLVVSGIGILIAMGYYIVAVIVTISSWMILELWRFEVKVGLKKK
ncbi:MAG: MgtC/SapB family protein [archaeon]